MSASQHILDQLTGLGIPYQNFEHPAVFTCEDSQLLCPGMPGKKNKNLFLRDRKGKRYFMVSLPQDKQADLKQLATMLEISGLSFASPERLQKVLGVEPGSVGILALLNDKEVLTEVWIDQELLEEEDFQSHPTINTESSCFKTSDLKVLFAATGHKMRPLQISR